MIVIRVNQPAIKEAGASQTKTSWIGQVIWQYIRAICICLGEGLERNVYWERAGSGRITNFVWARIQPSGIQDHFSAHFFAPKPRLILSVHFTASLWAMRAAWSWWHSQIIELMIAMMGMAIAAEQNDETSSISFNLSSWKTELASVRNYGIQSTSTTDSAFQL